MFSYVVSVTCAKGSGIATVKIKWQSINISLENNAYKHTSNAEKTFNISNRARARTCIHIEDARTHTQTDTQKI